MIEEADRPGDRFEKQFVALLEQLYGFGDNRVPAREVLSLRIKGFVEAGILLEVTTHERLQAIAEATHARIFGESLSERRTRAKLGVTTTVDWSKYDTPPSSRRT